MTERAGVEGRAEEEGDASSPPSRERESQTASSSIPGPEILTGAKGRPLIH